DWAEPTLSPATAASIAVRYDRRFIFAPCGLLVYLVQRFLARHREFDAVDAGAGRDIERFAIVAPVAVRRCFGRLKGPEMSAIRGEHPNARGPAVPEIALRVHLHAVGKPLLLFSGYVGEEFAIRD